LSFFGRKTKENKNNNKKVNKKKKAIPFEVIEDNDGINAGHRWTNRGVSSKDG